MYIIKKNGKQNCNVHVRPQRNLLHSFIFWFRKDQNNQEYKSTWITIYETQVNDIKVTFLNENMQIRNKSMNNLFDII
jgi:hypothetical protein